MNTLRILTCLFVTLLCVRQGMASESEESITPEAIYTAIGEISMWLDRSKWEYEVLNPSATKTEELEQTLERYYLLFFAADALIKLKEEGSEEYKDINLVDLRKFQVRVQFVYLFLEDKTNVQIVTFTESTDPAIHALREQFQIPAPEGAAYIRAFSRSDTDNPKPLQYIIDSVDMSTQAITYNGRYIFMLGNNLTMTEYTGIIDPINYEHDLKVRLENWERTLSHELVHAYVGCAVESPLYDFPRWFDEGLAIYCSGSNKSTYRALRSGETQYIQHLYAPEDYQMYERAFKELKRRAGNARFHTLISQCVEERTTEPLLQAAKVASYLDLCKEIERKSERRRLFVGVCVGIVILCIFLAVFFNFSDYHETKHDYLSARRKRR